MTDNMPIRLGTLDKVHATSSTNALRSISSHSTYPSAFTPTSSSVHPSYTSRLSFKHSEYSPTSSSNSPNVYSPITGRRIPVSWGPAGLSLASSTVKHSPYPIERRTRHKRVASTSNACAFCRKRKIACGSPPPGKTDRTCK